MAGRLSQAALALVLALVLGCCSTTTSARDTFGDEPLATDTFAGLEVLHEDWSDGSSGSPITGKSSQTQVTRKLVADDGAALASGFSELVATAGTSGWAREDDLSDDVRFIATKTLPAGTAQLLIRIYPDGDLSGDGNPYILVDLTV